MNDGGNRVQKLVATLCFASIAAAVLIARNAPSTGYELSTYASTPILVWLLLAICAISSIGLIVSRAFSNTQGINLGFILGPLGLAAAMVLSLPTLRGYYLYASTDSLFHTGKAFDIGSTSHLGSENFYPAIHILVAQISQVCGITFVTVARFLPVYLSIGCAIVWTSMVGQASLPERGQMLLTFAFAAGFLLNSLHVMVYPQTLPFLLVLVVLYLRLEGSLNQRPVGKVLIIICLLSIPYCHPIPAVMVVCFLLALELFNALFGKIVRPPQRRHFSVNLPLISTITFFTWIASYIVFGQTMRNLGANLREPLGGRHVQTLERLIQDAGTQSVLNALLKMYGDSIVCLILAAIGVAIVAFKIFSDRDKELKGIGALATVWVIALPIELFIFVGTGSLTLGRLANLTFAVFLSPVLAGYALYEILWRTRRVYAVALSSVLIVTIWGISVLGVYHSPWVSEPSWQTTYMHIQGIEWFLDNKEDDTLFTILDSPYTLLYALPHVLYGNRSALSMEDLTQSYFEAVRYQGPGLVEQYNYDPVGTRNGSVKEDRYLLITERVRLVVESPSLSISGLAAGPRVFFDFQLNDFVELTQNPSMKKLYTNGDLEVWRVSASP